MPEANSLVQAVLLAYFPIVIILHVRYPGPKAAFISMLAGMLFLPRGKFDLPGIPEYTTYVAIMLPTLVATVMFHSERVLALRFRLVDLAVVGYMLAQLPGAAAGVGLYDGVSFIFEETMVWGVPYLMGRIYLTSSEAILEFVQINLYLALAYIPFMLFEARMGTTLHETVYGYYPFGNPGQDMRWGGFRPVVFVGHGLAVASWFSSMTVLLFWMLLTRQPLPLLPFPTKFLLPGFAVMLVICKSVGPIALALLGCFLVFALLRLRMRFLVILLMVLPLMYLQNRIAGELEISRVAEQLSPIVPTDRIESLMYRLESEEVLIRHGNRRMLFGWGRVLNRPAVEAGEEDITTDSRWIITYTLSGLIGLGAFLLIYLGPVLRFLMLARVRLWTLPAYQGALLFTVIILLHVMDDLVNALSLPLFPLIAGGLASAPSPRRAIASFLLRRN